MRHHNIFCLLAAVFFLASIVFSNSIVGYWAMDESNGLIASDSSIKGNDGILVNMDSSDWISGYSKNALDFDGTESYVQLPRVGILENSNELVAEAWVQTTASSPKFGTIVGTEVIIVDHNTGFQASWLKDEIHPNSTGAIEMSDRWYNALPPLLTPVPRVIVSSDCGFVGTDPDDFQSFVHYFVYADKFETEGLISSPDGGPKAAILSAIDEYETDYSNLNWHAPFPTPQSLRDVTKQGATSVAPAAGYSTATEGSNWIISCANKSDPRPLWILVWGSITDVAQAVHDDPSIKSKIRIYSIGSSNTKHDPYARNYLYNNHSDLWWIENDSTFRGMYTGGAQSGDLGNTTFVENHVRYHGALGDFFYSKKIDIKMGDSPSVLYLLNGDLDDPTTVSWGGMFRVTGHGSYYWTDLTDPAYNENGYDGAKTVNIHRESYLRDWQTRMEWADAP